jgi:hypothetical protein
MNYEKILGPWTYIGRNKDIFGDASVYSRLSLNHQIYDIKLVKYPINFFPYSVWDLSPKDMVYIYNSIYKINDVKFRFISIIEAKNYVDQYLISNNYEFIEQERFNKLKLLI